MAIYSYAASVLAALKDAVQVSEDTTDDAHRNSAATKKLSYKIAYAKYSRQRRWLPDQFVFVGLGQRFSKWMHLQPFVDFFDVIVDSKITDT